MLECLQTKCGRTDDGQRPILKPHLSNKVNCPIPPGGHFHDDWAKNVTSRVKQNNVLTKFHENWTKNVTSRVLICFHCIHLEKTAQPLGGHVFSPIWTIFKFVPDINKTNVLTKFHDDWAKIVSSRVFKRKTSPPTGGNVFQRTGTTFELNQRIIKTIILQMFTSFKLDQGIIGTNLLTKTVASRVFTMKTAPPTGGHVFQRTRTT
ncbi:hypothetical protein DPMN_106669 [Dreissena polymorpha]|uniref:Uncharacterized protein n=1 Tax=Dreissena polymorpha TaxID=45954 RepID=A0A9D4K5D4_DREPO|nr:hypothetical protein DPMN_106669 [Dreissena polymorpha]